MSADAITVLDWTYEPKDFFEGPTEFAVAGGAVTLSEGKALGKFDGSLFEAGREFRDAMHESLLGYFFAQQVKVAKPFTLSAASLSRQHSDGRRDVTMCTEPATIVLTGGNVDFIITNAQGEVIRNSKTERLQSQQDFREKVMRLYETDRVVRRLLQMFNGAQNDTDNRLIHLYEIRDCLAHELGGDAKARTALGISDTVWSRFGRLANDEPLLEGRHRGKHLSLRNATRDELAFVTGFAQTLIERYVALASTPTPQP